MSWGGAETIGFLEACSLWDPTVDAAAGEVEGGGLGSRQSLFLWVPSLLRDPVRASKFRVAVQPSLGPAHGPQSTGQTVHSRDCP